MRLARDEGAILITGATGFIGRHVTRRFLKTGRRLIALARTHGGILQGNALKAAWG
jgi:nucleoside-diphosphate-sugar epimerase